MLRFFTLMFAAFEARMLWDQFNACKCPTCSQQRELETAAVQWRFTNIDFSSFDHLSSWSFKSANIRTHWSRGRRGQRATAITNISNSQYIVFFFLGLRYLDWNSHISINLVNYESIELAGKLLCAKFSSWLRKRKV